MTCESFRLSKGQIAVDALTVGHSVQEDPYEGMEAVAFALGAHSTDGRLEVEDLP